MNRPERLLFLLVFGVYAYFYQAGGWNQNSRFDLTRAVVESRSFAIDRYASNTNDTALVGLHTYSDKAPGVSLVGAVPYAVAYLVAGSPAPSAENLAWTSWLATVFAVGLPSALAVVAFAFLLEVFGVSHGWRLGLAAAWGLATLALPYSTLYYGHQAAAALLVIAFALLARMAHDLDPRSRVRLALAGAVLGWAVVTEYPAALAGAVLGGYALRKLRRDEVLWILVGASVPAMVLAGYHTLAFGAPWHLPYAASVQEPPHVGFFGIAAPSATALAKLTVSPYRGLFYSAPWLALAVPGAVLMWRRGLRAETVACVAIVGLFLWMNASLVVWYGGRALGPRHFVPAIPFLVVLVAGWLKPSAAHLPPLAVGIAIAAIAWSSFMMLAATAVRPEIDSGIAHPFGDYVLPKLLHGELATSDQSIDRALPDDGRHAWNLGEQLGLPGIASLAPLAAWCAITTVLLRRRLSASPDPAS